MPNFLNQRATFSLLSRHFLSPFSPSSSKTKNPTLHITHINIFSDQINSILQIHIHLQSSIQFNFIMATTSRSLEVTIISGENLRVDRTRPVKKNAFVVVRTDSSPISQSTNLDIDGGSYPTWNQTLLVDMPVHARFLNVDVQCRSNSGDKVVGTARIPASDFAGGYFPENYLHFLSYRLRDSGGERNGIVNLSVRVKVPEGSGRVAASSAATSCSQSRPWMGVPAAGKVSDGIVSGVPVWSRYY